MRVKKQTDVKECGPLIIQALHNHFFKEWVDINAIKNKAQFGSNGMNVKSLLKLGSEYGLDCQAFETDAESIIKEISDQYFITIFKQNGMHHYVIAKWNNNKFEINDSIKGKYKLTINQFNELFINCVITIEKGNYVQENIDISSPFKYIAKSPEIISWICFSIVLSIVITFTSTVFLKLVIDKVIPMHQVKLLNLLVISFISVAVFKALISLFKSYLVKKLSINLEINLTNQYLERLYGISSENRNKLTQADNLRRMSLIKEVSKFISTSIFVIFNEFIMFVVSAAVLIWISPSLFGISFLAASIVCIFTILFKSILKSKYNDAVEKQIKLFESMSNVSQMLIELKEPKIKKYISKDFNNKFENHLNNDYSIWGLSRVQDSLEMLINSITPIIITLLGTGLIFNSRMSIGSMVMFISIFNHFINPIKDLCDMIMSFPIMKKNMELISFVINMKDESNNKGILPDSIYKVGIHDATIGYDVDILRIKDLILEKSIHIRGPNGSGKSTLLKAIATIIPVKGELEFNSINSSQINTQLLRDKIFYLSQETYINKSSVIDYITLKDNIAMEIFMDNYRRFELDKLMSRLNISLNTIMENNASNLSSGQKQAIKLLRLFAFKYQLVILDEAIENLDKKSFDFIKSRITKFNDCIFLEVSHSKKYISKAKEVSINEISSNI